MTMNRVEVITSVERRRRWSAGEKARLVAAMDEPGAVVTEIARSAGVDASLIYRWRRELAGERDTPTFVPLRVSPAVSELEPASAPACAASPLPAPSSLSSSPASAITIAFGEQVRMTIEGAPDAATLANAIGALAARDRWR
jgi:transposase